MGNLRAPHAALLWCWLWHRPPSTAAYSSAVAARWSLEYQRVVDDDARVAMTDENIAGLALW